MPPADDTPATAFRTAPVNAVVTVHCAGGRTLTGRVKLIDRQYDAISGEDTDEKHLLAVRLDGGGRASLHMTRTSDDCTYRATVTDGPGSEATFEIEAVEVDEAAADAAAVDA